jgi:hypothetical protein
MKHLTTILSLCFALAAQAQDETPMASASPAPSPSPTVTPAGVAGPTPTPTPSPATAQPAAPPWLVPQSTQNDIPPGATPLTTVLRSSFKPIVIKQGQNWLIVFEWGEPPR